MDGPGLTPAVIGLSLGQTLAGCPTTAAPRRHPPRAPGSRRPGRLRAGDWASRHVRLKVGSRSRRLPRAPVPLGDGVSGGPVPAGGRCPRRDPRWGLHSLASREQPVVGSRNAKEEDPDFLFPSVF